MLLVNHSRVPGGSACWLVVMQEVFTTQTLPQRCHDRGTLRCRDHVGGMARFAESNVGNGDHRSGVQDGRWSMVRMVFRLPDDRSGLGDLDRVH